MPARGFRGATRGPLAGSGPCTPGTVSGAGVTSLMHLVVQAHPPALTATLPGTPASVSLARRLARTALVRCPRVDDLMLAVTELAANAIAHTASGLDSAFILSVCTKPGWARIEITDGGPAAGQHASGNGWGLTLVAGVTDRPEPSPGQTAAGSPGPRSPGRRDTLVTDFLNADLTCCSWAGSLRPLPRSQSLSAHS